MPVAAEVSTSALSVWDALLVVKVADTSVAQELEKAALHASP